jgi:hypothetical protein
VNFRNFIQFHVHSIKTYLHFKKNKKGKELEKKISDCKIIADDYLRTLETTSFFTNWQKKEEEVKLFSNEMKKVNV